MFRNSSSIAKRFVAQQQAVFQQGCHYNIRQTRHYTVASTVKGTPANSDKKQQPPAAKKSEVPPLPASNDDQASAIAATAAVEKPQQAKGATKKKSALSKDSPKAIEAADSD